MQNLELKARYPNHAFAKKMCLQLSAGNAGLLVQTDTYFNTPNGRLKLREAGGKSAELIHYVRPNVKHDRGSTYEILPLADGKAALAFLTKSFGILTVVKKKRHLYLVENIRIHLDTVSGLGKFLEFEIVIHNAVEARHSHKQMNALKKLFKISDQDIIAVSYSDLKLER
jgi:adenylate cyclase class 2